MGLLLPILLSIAFYVICTHGTSTGPLRLSDDARNVTAVSADSVKQFRYRLDYGVFLKKINRKRTAKRSLISELGDDMEIDSIDLKLNWKKFLKRRRLGTGFVLKKGTHIMENVMLYAPRDRSFTVRGLLDASGYMGEVRVVRNKQSVSRSNSTKPGDVLTFKIDTPRIISERETKPILNALSRLPENGIKIESVAVVLKLLQKYANNLYIEVMSVSSNSTVPRSVVHVVPNSAKVTVKDLPAHSVLKLTLKPLNSTRKLSGIKPLFLFTGSIISAIYNALDTASRISTVDKNGLRPTVTCYVDNKSPFQGFPCKGSDVCIPLHWECDGEDDCPDGHDELRCSGALGSQYTGQRNRCDKYEFQCLSRNKLICLPVSWICDGRRDCTNGWDEDEETCKIFTQQSGQTNHHYSGTSCKKNSFRCKRGGCISLRYVCDGHDDCVDGSDEFDCPDDEDEDEDVDFEFICDSKHEFNCFSSGSGEKCVPRPWMCDDQNDCPSGEDEEPGVCRSFFEKSL